MVHRLVCIMRRQFLLLEAGVSLLRQEKYEVKIRVARINPDSPYEAYAIYEKYLPHERKEKIQRFRFEPDKIRSLIAGVLLRQELDVYLADKDADAYEIKKGEHGKPYLAGADDFHFSISHAGAYVALAIDEQPVGIDVELVQIREAVARRFYSEREQEEIRFMQEADAKDDGKRAEIAFTKIWTGKEAYLKYTGNGITNALAEIGVLDPSFWRKEQIYFSGTAIADDTYYVTVCTQKQVSISDKIVIEDMTAALA